MLLAFLLTGCACRLHAQKAFTLHADSLDKNIELSFVFADWYFHPGDLQQPVISTAGWTTLPTTSFGKDDAPPGWTGFGWFAIWLNADAKAVNKKIDLRIAHDGASEIFMDGKPVGGFGKPGLLAETTKGARYPRTLIPLWFADTLPHLLAIRYANFAGIHPDFTGFETYIGDYRSVDAMLSRGNNLRAFIPMCAAAQWMLALMHLLLFLFYPKQKLHLYFAAYAAIMGVLNMGSYLYYETHQPLVQYYVEYAGNECIPLLMWFGGLRLYNLGYGYIPAWKKTALAIICGIYFAGFFLMALGHSHLWEARYQPVDYVSLLFWLFLVFFCDELWGIFRAIRQGKPGLWLIGIGVVSAVIAISFSWLDIFSVWPARQNGLRLFTMSAGTLVFPICVSLYLALDFARTNKSLTARLEEVNRLSALALEQEAEKRELLETEARRLEDTVRERTAELQRQTDRLQELDGMKSRFFANITHEFKTPLTLISNPAEALLATNKDASVQYHASLVRRNADRLLQLINQLLDLSKLESGLMAVNLSPLELVAALKKQADYYMPLAKQKGIELDVVSDWQELWIRCDYDKLEKITGNLLSNALKFTDKGRVEIALKKNGEGAFIVAVKDTGKGIPASKLPYIFERFYQADLSDIRSAEGTGIGLALTRELVTLLGGDIRAESVEGEYTLMELSLPLQPAFPVQPDDAMHIQRPLEIASPVYDREPPPPAGKAGDLVLVIEDTDE
ncbi:MAG: HAMP domain-containing sensor histidine kinase [Flavihumibacter sp.]